MSPEAEYARVHLEFEKGDLDAALKDVEALSYRTANLGVDWLWRVRLLKSEILVWRGLDDQVLSLLEQPVPDRLSGWDFAARRLIFLGLAQGHTHRFDESTRSFQLAEQLSAAAHPELLGEIYLARGSVQIDQGSYEEALKSYQVALQKARDFHLPFLEANAAGSLGYASTWLERYDQAIDWYKTSLSSSDSLGARATSAKTLGNLGWSYHELGDLKIALEQFEKAEKSSKDAGLKLDEAYWRLSAGTVRFDQGEYSDARARMLRALELADALHDSSTITECHQNLALVAIQEGQYEEAHRRLEDAVQSNASTRDFKREQYNRLLSSQLDLREKQFDPAARKLVELAADPRLPTSLRWEAQAGLAQVHAAQGKNALAEKEFAQSVRTISGARDAIVHEEFRLSFLSSAIRFYDEYVNFLLSQHRTLDALSVADRSRAQTLEHGLALKPNSAPKQMTAAPAQRPEWIARKQNATLLLYWLGQDRSYLWVVTAKGVSLFTLPRSSEIEAAAQSYRASFDGPLDPLESANADGIKLYDILIRPAEKLIPKNSRVIILPDGSLNDLNFETLIVSFPQLHYWIEDSTISVANSLSLLARARSDPPPASGSLLLFGAPVSPAKEYPPLPDAEKETAAVRQYFPEARRTLFLGADAKASAYLTSNPGKYSYLHFATHGVASLTRPLESAIVLTREGDSYKLYAREIMQHPLNAYLVSISACNGTGTSNLAGEGLIGLSWAFLRAGAHNVVAGLWEVSTASTPQIMDGLYEGLTEGKDPATALRDAKLALLHSSGAYRRPFYWAPFQLYSGS